MVRRDPRHPAAKRADSPQPGTALGGTALAVHWDVRSDLAQIVKKLLGWAGLSGLAVVRRPAAILVPVRVAVPVRVPGRRRP